MIMVGAEIPKTTRRKNNDAHVITRVEAAEKPSQKHTKEDNPGKTVCLEVQDDDMAPSILPGDIIYYQPRPCPKPRNGDYVVIYNKTEMPGKLFPRKYVIRADKKAFFCDGKGHEIEANKNSFYQMAGVIKKRCQVTYSDPFCVPRQAK